MHENPKIFSEEKMRGIFAMFMPHDTAAENFAIFGVRENAIVRFRDDNLCILD